MGVSTAKLRPSIVTTPERFPRWPLCWELLTRPFGEAGAALILQKADSQNWGSCTLENDPQAPRSPPTGTLVTRAERCAGGASILLKCACPVLSVVSRWFSSQQLTGSRAVLKVGKLWERRLFYTETEKDLRI